MAEFFYSSSVSHIKQIKSDCSVAKKKKKILKKRGHNTWLTWDKAPERLILTWALKAKHPDFKNDEKNFKDGDRKPLIAKHLRHSVWGI